MPHTTTPHRTEWTAMQQVDEAVDAAERSAKRQRREDVSTDSGTLPRLGLQDDGSLGRSDLQKRCKTTKGTASENRSAADERRSEYRSRYNLVVSHVVQAYQNEAAVVVNQAVVETMKADPNEGSPGLLRGPSPMILANLRLDKRRVLQRALTKVSQGIAVDQRGNALSAIPRHLETDDKSQFNVISARFQAAIESAVTSAGELDKLDSDSAVAAAIMDLMRRIDALLRAVDIEGIPPTTSSAYQPCLPVRSATTEVDFADYIDLDLCGSSAKLRSRQPSGSVEVCSRQSSRCAVSAFRQDVKAGTEEASIDPACLIPSAPHQSLTHFDDCVDAKQNDISQSSKDGHCLLHKTESPGDITQKVMGTNGDLRALSLFFDKDDDGVRDSVGVCSAESDRLTFDEIVEKALRVVFAMSSEACSEMQELMRSHSFRELLLAIRKRIQPDVADLVLQLHHGDTVPMHTLQSKFKQLKTEQDGTGVYLMAFQWSFDILANVKRDVNPNRVHAVFVGKASRSFADRVKHILRKKRSSTFAHQSELGVGGKDNGICFVPLLQIETHYDLDRFFRPPKGSHFAGPAAVREAFISLAKSVFAVMLWSCQTWEEYNTAMRKAFPRADPVYGLNENPGFTESCTEPAEVSFDLRQLVKAEVRTRLGNVGVAEMIMYGEHGSEYTVRANAYSGGEIGIHTRKGERVTLRLSPTYMRIADLKIDDEVFIKARRDQSGFLTEDRLLHGFRLTLARMDEHGMPCTPHVYRFTNAASTQARTLYAFFQRKAKLPNGEV